MHAAFIIRVEQSVFTDKIIYFVGFFRINDAFFPVHIYEMGFAVRDPACSP